MRNHTDQCSHFHMGNYHVKLDLYITTLVIMWEASMNKLPIPTASYDLSKWVSKNYCEGGDDKRV